MLQLLSRGIVKRSLIQSLSQRMLWALFEFLTTRANFQKVPEWVTASAKILVNA
jgi:hypothetical protein